jgi:hypothetical protein
MLYVANVIGEGLMPDPTGKDTEKRETQTVFFPPARVDDDEPVYVHYGDDDSGVRVLVFAVNEDAAYDSIVRAFGPGNFEQVDDGPQLADRQMTTGEVLHRCDEFAVTYASDGPIGHGWECGLCGRFLQAG